jgi:type I restriction enzyme S subunit
MGNEWPTKELGSLVDENRGISYGIVQPGSPVEVGIPIVRVNNIRNGRIDTSDMMKVDPAIAARFKRTVLMGGELLLTLVGTVGESAVVPPEFTGWNTARAVAVIPVKKDPGSQWVYLCLRTAEVQHLMKTWCTTTVQATLNLRDVSRIPIVLPPEDEREAIAALLGSLDDKIELNRQMNKMLEDLASTVFKAWFIDFAPIKAKVAGAKSFPSMSQEVFDSLPDTLIDSALGDVPMGWEVLPLPDVIEVNPARSLRKGEVAPYLDMSNMPTANHAPNEWIQREAGSGMRFNNGDTLVARITPCLENGKTAYVDFLADGQVGWGSTEYIVLRPKPPLPLTFGYCLARSEGFREFAIQRMTGSSGRQRVPAEGLKQFNIAMPPQRVAEAFGSLVEPLFVMAKANMDESRTLAALRDTLLPRLLSGEVRVMTAQVPERREVVSAR